MTPAQTPQGPDNRPPRSARNNELDISRSSLILDDKESGEALLKLLTRYGFKGEGAKAKPMLIWEIEGRPAGIILSGNSDNWKHRVCFVNVSGFQGDERLEVSFVGFPTRQGASTAGVRWEERGFKNNPWAEGLREQLVEALKHFDRAQVFDPSQHPLGIKLLTCEERSLAVLELKLRKSWSKRNELIVRRTGQAGPDLFYQTCDASLVSRLKKLIQEIGLKNLQWIPDSRIRELPEMLHIHPLVSEGIVEAYESNETVKLALRRLAASRHSTLNPDISANTPFKDPYKQVGVILVQSVFNVVACKKAFRPFEAPGDPYRVEWELVSHIFKTVERFCAEADERKELRAKVALFQCLVGKREQAVAFVRRHSTDLPDQVELPQFELGARQCSRPGTSGS